MAVFDDDLCGSHAALLTMTARRENVCRDLAVNAVGDDNAVGGSIGLVGVGEGDPISLEFRLADLDNGVRCAVLGGTSVKVYVTAEVGSGRTVLEKHLRRNDGSVLGHQVRAVERNVVGAHLAGLDNGIMCIRFGWDAFEAVLR